MLSRVVPSLPNLTGDWREDGPKVYKALQDHFHALNALGALVIQSAAIDQSPIGANSASTGKFTTLEATGAATLTTVAASGKVDTATYLEFGTGTTLFSKSNGALTAGSDLDCTTAASALLVIRNNTDGGMALVTVDIGTGTCTEVSDPGAFVTVGADPGAASSQFWITTTGGTTIRLRNRYAATKNVGVIYLMLGGTPA
jgi:hypothetical protein